MKCRGIIGALALFLIIGITGALAGWLTSVETSFTGTTYNYTNDITPATMLSVGQVACSWAAAGTNTVDLYRVDSAGNAFLLETTEAQTNLQYCTFTPPGNGVYWFPNGDILRIVQTRTAKCTLIIDRLKPQ